MADKSGFKIEIIPNMYDLGLFKSVLATQRKLRICTIAAIVLLCACFWSAGAYIRYFSTHTWLNMFLVLFLYIGVLVVSYITALAIGDLFFAGPWREKMMRGAKFVPDSIEDQKALLKNKSIYFLLLWVAAIACLGLGCDFVTGGNLHWFHSIGGILTSMRSSDDTERTQVMETISSSFYDKQWKEPEIQKRTNELIMDGNDDVRRHAAYIAGRAHISEANDNLIKLLRDTSASESARAEAAIALGNLEWKPARADLLSVIRNRFKKSHGDDTLLASSFYAFFKMKDPAATRDAISILDTCLETQDCGSLTLQYTFFYLKSLRSKDGATVSFKYLDAPNSTPEQKCYAADILRFTASENDIPRMKEAFKNTGKNAECPVVYRKHRKEASVILFEHDPMRALFVRAIGNLKTDDSYDWIWMVGADTTENMMTRKVAEMYARALQKK